MSLEDTPRKANTYAQDQTYASDVSEDADVITKEQKSIGVQKAEILAKQWDTWYHKLILLFSAFLVGYAYGLDGQVRYIFTGYATASFNEHSLLTTVSAITAVVAAAAQPIYARLSDIFGRLELFIVSMLFYIVGTVIECRATNFARYAAGSVFYQIGYTGAILMVLFILSDFSTLKWRLFYSFVPTFPFIINTWISGNVTAAVGTHWSWGIGMWAFIYPLACIPLICCMLHMRWKAGRTEEWRVFKQRKTKFQELGAWGFAKHLFWKLDIVGCILLIVLLGCILVPLTVAGGIHSKWKSGSIIAPLVVGFVLIPPFLYWEAKLARVPVFPYHLLRDRGVWSASFISCFLDLISGIESSYLYTVLVVAVYQSELSATRISSLSSFVSVIVGAIFGLFIVYFKRLKGFIIFGNCLWIVAFGLLIRYRAGQSSRDGIIGANCVLGFGTALFTYPISVSVQSCVSHEHMASAIALLYTLYRVGAAVGATIAGALWSGLLHDKLKQRLPLKIADSAYSDPYNFIVSYPKGTPERNIVIDCYKYIQKILMVVALCLCVPMLCAAFFIRDHKLGDTQSIEEIERRQEQENLIGFTNRFFGKKKDNVAGTSRERDAESHAHEGTSLKSNVQAPG